MRTAYAPRPLAPSIPSGRPQPRRLAWLGAHLRAGRIDRELARGVATWRSRVHAARSLQLTGPRSRRSLARSLERLVDHAEHPSPPFLSAAIAPCRGQVFPARAVIEQLSRRLRAGEPVAAGGVAQLRALLADGAGPAYVSSDPDALRSALETVCECLDVLD